LGLMAYSIPAKEPLVMIQTISRASLTLWLDALTRDYTVIAPKRVEKLVLYKPISSAEEAVYDFGRTGLSAKEHFLPMMQSIVNIRKDQNGLILEVPRLGRSQVIFGLRPCDARALRVLDAVLLSDPADAYYGERREKTVTVGIACKEPQEGCFCTSMGGAPDDERDLDILLVEMNEGYAVRAVTDRGRALLASASLSEADATLPVSKAPEALPLATLDTWQGRFNEAYWARLSDRCLGCRLCAYVCPTCYCFDVRDYAENSSEIKRLRCWDSCQASGCYRLAGGHNPRPTKRERLRQRFYHKLVYYGQRFNVDLCVGCGRCVVQCPANIDIREIIADVARH